LLLPRAEAGQGRFHVEPAEPNQKHARPSWRAARRDAKAKRGAARQSWTAMNGSILSRRGQRTARSTPRPRRLTMASNSSPVRIETAG
jgi:hypothetical protein